MPASLLFVLLIILGSWGFGSAVLVAAAEESVPGEIMPHEESLDRQLLPAEPIDSSPDSLWVSDQQGLRDTANRFNLPAVSLKSLPVSVEDPVLRYKRIVDDIEVPAYAGPNKPLAGSVCSDGEATTNNHNASKFAKSYPLVFASIAAVISVKGNISSLIGTAVVVGPGILVSARHVITYLAGQTITGEVTTMEASKSFLVFGLAINQFPSGIPPNFDWSKAPNAVKIPQHTRVLNDTRYDIGLMLLPEIEKVHPPLALQSASLSITQELAIVGVPGFPSGDDATDPIRYFNDYKICNLPQAAGLDQSTFPVVIRVGTGALSDTNTGDINIMHVKIDTLDGNSGSPIFDAETGKIVGINVATEPGYKDSNFYNVAVAAKEIVALQASLDDLTKRFARLQRTDPNDLDLNNRIPTWNGQVAAKGIR